MIEKTKVPISEMRVKGHCRVDYTDPVTGRVLERIEGDNHVFEDQFFASAFQQQCLQSTLLLTDGTAALDTSLPWIPGKPVGYANPSGAATGYFQGAYRASDSYIDVPTQNGTESLYVYDFLTSQIPGTIRYVGLTGAYRVGTAITPFRFRWPRNNFEGIYDVARKRWIGGLSVSLSNNSGGAGSISVQTQINNPGTAADTLDLFSLLGSPDNYFPTLTHTDYRSGEDRNQTAGAQGFNASLFWDSEDQHIGIRIRRYRWDYYMDYYEETLSDYAYHYTLRFREDIWTFNTGGTTVYDHYTHAWTAIADERNRPSSDWHYYVPNHSGGYAPGYGRLYGSTLYTFSSYDPTYQRDADAIYQYIYRENIVTGSFSYDQISAGGKYPITSYSDMLYCFNEYTFGRLRYNDTSEFPIDGVNTYTNWGAASNYMGVVPMIDITDESIYTWCPSGQRIRSNYESYAPIERGQTAVWGNVWNIKPYFSTFSPSGSIGTMEMPFAYTAYKLPSNAPTRPSGSAVTIAYGLSVSW